MSSTPSVPDQAEFLSRLDQAIANEWARIMQGPSWQHMKDHGFTKDIARLILVELYHYTRYNPINQAIAAISVDPSQTSLVRFCLEHAREELGHEKMLVRDLEAMGLLDSDSLTKPPMPATQALIGYLHYVGLRLGAVARLGYSYWAESAYDYIGELLQSARSSLGVNDRHLTFFVAHQAIDTRHAQEVREAIVRWATSESDQNAIIDVARTTLYLTGRILEDVILEVSDALVRP